MKVLQVLNHFLPQQTAGTEVYTWALSKRLQQAGLEVQVLIPHYGKKEDAAYVYDGIPVHQYAEPSVVDRSLVMGFRVPDGLAYFRDILQKEKPGIVHFHELAGSNGITLKHVEVAKKSGAKVLMTFHLAGYSCKTGTLVYKGKELCDGVIGLHKCAGCYLHGRGYTNISPLLVAASGLFHRFSIDTTGWNHKAGTALGTVQLIDNLQNNLRELADNCDRLVAITQWYQQVLIANGVDKAKICYIPQGLPLSVEATAAGNRKEGPLRLLFLGRINPFKGLHLLIEALKEMDEQSVTLSVYGHSDDAAYESALRSTTSEQKNIYWRGKLQQQDVVATMQQHDVLCLCSTFSEMSPLVIQEAFAAGIPVLASEVYGNAEQVEHGKNGLLFRFNDVLSLKEQLMRLINEKDLCAELKKNIKAPRTFDVVAEEYLQLYAEMLGR